jgi:hypothetical protein
MLAPGRARIQVPLEQIPSEFTNDIAFFDEYIDMQTQLQSAATLLSDSQSDLAQMQKKIEGIKQATSIAKWEQKELDHFEADYAEKYHRYQTARAVYISYEKQWKSPFDLKQTDTVVNLIRF